MGNTQHHDTQIQSVDLPGTEKPGYTRVYRCPEQREKELLYYSSEEVKTLHQNFFRTVKNHPQRPCVGIRKFEQEGGNGSYYWQTYETVGKRILNFASGLIHNGAKKGDHIGIFAKNRPEWVIAEYACYAQSLIPVALYDTLGPESASFIINHAELKVIVCSQDKIPKLLALADQCPNMKLMIQIEYEGSKELIDKASAKGIKLLSFAEVEDRGAFQSFPVNEAQPEDLATIMYTSGTTGVPKGVMLTHKNIVSAISSASLLVQLRGDDVLISFLPMAHIFERVIQCVLFWNGAAVGFYSGDVQKLFDDMQVLHPTILAGVPRLFSRMFDKIMHMKDSKGGLSKFLFDLGYSSKQNLLEGGQDASNSWWNSLVFDKIRERFGNRIRLVVSGAAPITRDVFQFLQICFSCPILQGYGLTETTATGAITSLTNLKPGHCGAPQHCIELRLADVPDMKYFSTDKPCPRGEVCFRGNSVFIGYYKSPDQTKAAFDDDGYFLTGDIGQINPDGTLSIIDRKKNIFKLAQGEYVAAEYLEGVFQKNKFVAQIFVYGDSDKTSLVGVVVPDPDVLLPWAKDHNIPDADKLDALCKNKTINKMILDEITQTGKEAKLLGFEFVKAIYLESQPFSIENDLLTPTMKAKRPQLKDYYKQALKDLYDSLPPSQ